MKLKHNRGEIKHNAQAALVRSNIYRHDKHKAKKGKGSYTRKTKHKNSNPFGKRSKRIFSKWI